MAVRVVALTALSSVAAGCQSTPAAHSGFLSSYEGLGAAEKGQRAKNKRRDDTLSNAITRVYLEPAILKVDADTPIQPEEQAMVRNEIDRQICYQVSKRFELAPAPAADVATIRTAIVRIEPTNAAGSAASAAASFFIPVPMVKVRAPKSAGGLAVESELIAPDGRQAAAITWSKSIGVVGKTDPSLSQVGDALQLAKPFGGALTKAYANKAEKKRPVPDPDPCARFGPRRNAGRFVGSALLNIGTGLYSPSVAGAGKPAETQASLEPQASPAPKVPEEPKFAAGADPQGQSPQP
jgi:hypothetical protein